jgi:hypothetical protein
MQDPVTAVTPLLSEPDSKILGEGDRVTISELEALEVRDGH